MPHKIEVFSGNCPLLQNDCRRDWAWKVRWVPATRLCCIRELGPRKEVWR